MLTKTVFTSTATTTGGRAGRTEAASGRVSHALSRPTEMGGDGVGTNPEELFACGYSACFGGTLEFLAKQKGIDIGQSVVTAHIAFGPDAAGGFGIGCTLEVSLPGIERSVAEELLHAAHQNCPYSKAIRGNVEVEIVLR
ncbi:organic hydroperoxide resistance protein [Enterovirga sp. CN4-39]|uniref:organic hydroperoxide resistance protein n=1 Tax=Enterovirga sp. CN4-39 TaxID=3400910 RepID=UPI003C0B9A40